MKTSSIALFLAVLAIGACVGDPPAGPPTEAGRGGTDQRQSDAGGSGTHDGGSGGDSNGSGNGGVVGGESDGGGQGAAMSCANVDGSGACASGSVCCAAQDPDDVNRPSFACEADAPTCEAVANAVAVMCRSADDCTGGGVCCGRKADDNNTIYASIRCEPACTGAYTIDHELFCNPADAHACDARPGYPNCTPSDLMPGMYGCHSN